MNVPVSLRTIEGETSDRFEDDIVGTFPAHGYIVHNGTGDLIYPSAEASLERIAIALEAIVKEL